MISLRQIYKKYIDPHLDLISGLFGIISSILSLYIIISRWFPAIGDTKAEILLQQSARWALAAEQDENPLIALLHANYAAAYLYALRDTMTDMEIANQTGQNPLKFQQKIQKVQKMATQRALLNCPNLSTQNDNELSILAGE